MKVTPFGPPCLRLVLTWTLGLLVACQEAPTPVAAPSQPIIQNNQIRYPADHPQLTLLQTADVASAHNLRVELPAPTATEARSLDNSGFGVWANESLAAMLVMSTAAANSRRFITSLP